MPSVSKKQHNLMVAVANNPKFAKKVGIPQSVGEDFMEADKGKKFRGGGSTRAGINKPKTHHGKMQMPNYNLSKYLGKNEGGILKGNEMKDAKMMGRMKSKGEHAAQKKSKRGAEMVMMAKGGVTRADGVAKKGHTKGKMVAMKKGGYC